MSARPRFVVTSVTGFSGEGGNNARMATAYQVLDRPFCHELVFETLVRKAAERIAAELNGGDLKAAARQMQIRATQATQAAREAGYKAAGRK